MALNTSETFDRIWHEALMSKLHSNSFYPSLCNFISGFLSGYSIAAVTDSYSCSVVVIIVSCRQHSSPSVIFYAFLLVISTRMLMSPIFTSPHSLIINPQNKNSSNWGMMHWHTWPDQILTSSMDWKNLFIFSAVKIQFLHLPPTTFSSRQLFAHLQRCTTLPSIT